MVGRQAERRNRGTNVERSSKQKNASEKPEGSREKYRVKRNEVKGSLCSEREESGNLG